MEILAEIPDTPVQFDDERGAFFLSGTVAIRYCLSCGGKLPEPQYGTAIDPDPCEEQEAREIVASVSSLNELIRVLGKPDEFLTEEEADSHGFMSATYRVFDRYPESFVDAPALRWTRYVRYANRWPSLVLDVYEFPDGKLEPNITGILPDQFVILQTRRWWSRLLPSWKHAT